MASVDCHNIKVAEELFALPSSLFTVIPNGSRAAPAGHLGGPRLHDENCPLTIGHVGVIDEGKGWRITAAAIELLRAQGKPVRLLIAGHGREAGAAKAWCVMDPKRGEFVGFRANPYSDVFPRIDALSLPSLSEGLPMAVLEALAFGAPVLATAVGGLPEAVIPGKNGYIIDRTAESVADAVNLLLDVKHQRAMAQAAQAAHRERYSLEAMGRAYEELYFTPAALLAKTDDRLKLT